MNRPIVDTSSRLPKSSSIKNNTIGHFRKDKSPRTTCLSLKNEIDTAKLMPTIKEETITELNELNKSNRSTKSNSNNQNDKSNKLLKDDSSYKRLKLKLSPKTHRLTNQLESKSDDKISKSINIDSNAKLSQSSRLLNSTKVSLNEKKTKNSLSNGDKKSSSGQFLTKTVNNYSLNRDSIRLSTRKDDSLSLNSQIVIKNKDFESDRKLNSNLNSDQIKIERKDVKINSKLSKESNNVTLQTTIKPKNQMLNNFENEHSKDDLKDELKVDPKIDLKDDLKADSKDKSIYADSQIDFLNQDKSNIEQHICRICLDTIQVDESDLNCLESKVISTNETVNNSTTNSIGTKLIKQTDDQFINTKTYIAPCSCKGQSKFVHRKCLSEWIYVSKKTNCQVCLTKFRNIKINVFKKSVMKWLADEYDHLLMLILYLIPFMIDCILIFNFLTYDMQAINVQTPIKQNMTNSIEDVDFQDDQIDQLEQASRLDLNEIESNSKMNKIDSNLDQPKEIKSNLFSSFISFKRTKNLSRTMSFNMFVYNLYFLEIKFFLKNFTFCLSGIPVTLLVSFPSLILFIRYCKSRYQEWQAENLEVFID